MNSLLASAGRRAVATTVIAAGLILAVAGPAGAHIEATAAGARAGTGPVTVAFVAEGESTTAGIVGVKTQLPRASSRGRSPCRPGQLAGPSRQPRTGTRSPARTSAPV